MKIIKQLTACLLMAILSIGQVWGADGDVIVTILPADIPDGYTATKGTSGSFTKTVKSANDLTINYEGINTKSSATAEDHSFGYAMFMNGYGFVYSGVAPTSYYPSNVVVTFTASTGTSGKAGIIYNSSKLNARNSSVTGSVSKGGYCFSSNNDKTKVYWNFSTTGANVQVASIVVTYSLSGESPTPTLSIDPTSVSVDATSVDQQSIDLTTSGFSSAVTSVTTELYSDEGCSTAITSGQWVKNITVNSENTQLTFDVDDNTGAARQVWLKITASNATESAYAILPISQAKYSAPTGTFIKFTGDLVEGDYVFVVSDEAMTNTISNNRLTNTGVTTASNTITNPDGAIVWHIAASGDYWTIYNAEAEKYAASTGVENQVQLLADGTDDKAKWSVTVNGETFQFLNKANAANNVNAKLEHFGANGWACYSAYSNISLYKKVLPEETIRSVEPGTWGTICPEKEVLQPSGASFYTIDYVEMQDGTPSRVFFSEIGETESLRAGHPYVFVAEEDAIKGAQTGAAATEGFNDHGFIGCIDDFKFHVYDEDTRDKYYVIYQNQIMRCTDGWFLLKAGGAYLDMKDPTLRTEGSAAPAPGRRRLTLTNPEAAPQVATDLNTITDNSKPVKVIINNRMFILRDGILYDATGRLVKEQD